MGSAKVQGELWGARAGDWVEANEPAWSGVFHSVHEATGVTTGTRLLDVGCGAGGALRLARQRGAIVSGLDAAANLVALARQRLPGASIEVGEMEVLPYDHESFDVVTGINSFQFAGNISAALGEARRVCRKKGTVAMLVWGKKQDCQLLTVVMPAVIALLPPPAANAPPPLQLADPGVIEGLMTGVGLVPVVSREIEGTLAYVDVATAIRAVMSATARAIRHVGEETVRAAVSKSLVAVTMADGSVVLNNKFRLVTATRA